MILGLVIASLIIGSLALILSAVSLIMIIAREKSTHTVQLMPVDEEIDRANKEYMSKWATSEEAIKKEQNLYKEEVEEQMPEFSLTDEDKEVFSL
jgi:F0F1-type ATP synthase membrane subunit b/b'